MTERIIAIVPVRSLRDGKTRMAPVLGPEVREALLRRTAACVVEAARTSGMVETVVVVSPEPEVLAWASGIGRGVVALRQPDHLPSLNGAIDAGRQWAQNAGADAVLSLFADLPFLTADDVRRMAEQTAPVVLGADRRGEGTNALLLRLSGQGAKFRYAFGEGSLAHHQEEAHRLGLQAAIYEAPGIGFDLDTPEDWTDYLDQQGLVAVAPDQQPAWELVLGRRQAFAG
jgi:2-phospho-L-lactate guanylyltransferase